MWISLGKIGNVIGGNKNWALPILRDNESNRGSKNWKTKSKEPGQSYVQKALRWIGLNVMLLHWGELVWMSHVIILLGFELLS